ncbi:hypothetical protein AGDE_14604 [Angomonas deanei]|uniref:Uncharacterized protein n=1 Tax=Angomonas deanei TaxID=59799 RepID=A0A7G2CRQ6_9TRYP|nr:hypothetical protein AGDE_14604 [Angomonas deanei]CAD2222049.1 hypothetical protein, conserved [Angomonas deanei]|eukprot:EPY20557.1 hypothetical protein AGDE_14604 [Angomonas deanei]
MLMLRALNGFNTNRFLASPSYQNARVTSTLLALAPESQLTFRQRLSSSYPFYLFSLVSILLSFSQMQYLHFMTLLLQWGFFLVYSKRLYDLML